MADPLSITTSIIAVLQVTGAIVNYLRDVRDAPRDREDLLAEITTLESFLCPLERRVRQARHEDPWLTALRALVVVDGPLDQLKFDLHRLESKLRSVKRTKEIGWKLKWTFTKADIKDVIAKIERVKTLVTIALTSDLFSLCHAIKGELSEFKATVQTNQNEEMYGKIANWLSPLNFKKSQIEIFQTVADGTGQWLLQSKEFTSWRDGTSETLWCRGIPGGGKTAITSIVVNHLETLFIFHNIAVACIYCNYKEQTEQKVSNLVASLLKQILEAPCATFDRVKALYERHKSQGTHPALDELTAALRSAIEEYSQVFIVVDALDECREDTWVDLLEVLRSLPVTVNLMVTSRDIPSIEWHLDITKRLDIRASDADVRRYVEKRIIRAHRQHLTALTDNIMDRIVGNIGGMFLLARLHMDSLVGKHCTAQARRALENLPKEVDDTYDEAMERIMQQTEEDSNLAKQVLSWIVYAYRPLSVKEIQHALAVRPGMRHMDIEGIIDEEILTSVCAGLVVIDAKQQIVRLVHHTTQQYFERKRDILFPDVLVDITAKCVSYLSFDTFEKGYCCDDSELDLLLDDNPLLDYATRYWGHHARGQLDKDCRSMILSLLRDGSKVACISQVLLVNPKYTFWVNRSQRFPKDVSGMHISAFFGLQDIVEHQIENGDAPDLVDSDGRTPLSWAAEHGHEQVARLLVDCDDVAADSKDASGRTPLSWAARYGHEEVVKLLVARDDVDTNAKDTTGRTSLWWAAWHGREEVVKVLVALDGVEADSTDKYGRTPLSWAASNGRAGVVRILVARDAVAVNSKDVLGRTPLSWAAETGRDEAVQVLIARGDVEVDVEDVKGRTPLSLAASNNRQGVVRLLVAHDGVDADSRDIEGRTPLSWAARYGHAEVVKVLVAREDVHADSKSKNGRTPLSWATATGKPEVVKMLAARDDVEADSRDNAGRTPLSWAVENGETVVQLLVVRRDVAADSKDAEGRTPLSWAAAKGCQAVVDLLLNRGDVDADSGDIKGRTPLCWAAYWGREDVVQMLLERDDVDADSRGTAGRTPLSWAAAKGRQGVVQQLVARDDVAADARDAAGRTPLSWAAEYGHDEVVQLLIRRDDVDVEAKDTGGRTPLSWAATYGHEHVVKLLAARDEARAKARRLGGTLDKEVTPIPSSCPRRVALAVSSSS